MEYLLSANADPMLQAKSKMTAIGLAQSNGHPDIVAVFQAARQPGDCWFTKQSENFVEKKALRDAFHARIEKFNRNQEAQGKRVHVTPGTPWYKTICHRTHTRGALARRSTERGLRMEERLAELPDADQQQYKEHGLRRGVKSPSKDIVSGEKVHLPWYNLAAR